MSELIRPFGNKCANCPLSLESERVALEIPRNSDPGSVVEDVRQFCDWDNWLKRTAVVSVERVVKGQDNAHTFTAKEIVGAVPKDCPMISL